jgi:hypothetical protein
MVVGTDNPRTADLFNCPGTDHFSRMAARISAMLPQYLRRDLENLQR